VKTWFWLSVNKIMMQRMMLTELSRLIQDEYYLEMMLI